MGQNNNLMKVVVGVHSMTSATFPLSLELLQNKSKKNITLGSNSGLIRLTITHFLKKQLGRLEKRNNMHTPNFCVKQGELKFVINSIQAWDEIPDHQPSLLTLCLVRGWLSEGPQDKGTSQEVSPSRAWKDTCLLRRCQGGFYIWFAGSVSHSLKEENELTWWPHPFGVLDETMEFYCLHILSKVDLPTIASWLTAPQSAPKVLLWVWCQVGGPKSYSHFSFSCTHLHVPLFHLGLERYIARSKCLTSTSCWNTLKLTAQPGKARRALEKDPVQRWHTQMPMGTRWVPHMSKTSQEVMWKTGE